jgi:hypothetical protein
MLEWILVILAGICLIIGILLTVRTLLLMNQKGRNMDALTNQIYALCFVVTSTVLSTISVIVKWV